jgi:hypothetical protein
MDQHLQSLITSSALGEDIEKEISNLFRLHELPDAITGDEQVSFPVLVVTPLDDLRLCSNSE